MSLNNPRISRSSRLKLADRAEEAIMKYAAPLPETGAPPFALWHKHVHGADLDPMQVLKMHQMWEHPNTIDVSCRRTRKTSTKELYCLMKIATKPFQNEGIVAPRVQQSQNNMLYHGDSIDRSPMLSAYIDHRAGRSQRSDTSYRFRNKSGADCYGIMSQVDGDSLTIASLEETDDMPHDRLFSRFMPMLGASQRLGQGRDQETLNPDVRITGVFKGADVLQSMIDSGSYHLLPSVDVNLGELLGIISKPWIEQMRAEQSAGEWIRQFLCLNRSSQNFIWEKHVRWSVAMGVQAGIQMAEPMPGVKYRKRGLISFGYDHLGHGESATASKSSLVVLEQIGGWTCVVFVKTWAASSDDKTVMMDLVSMWDYFMPDCAIGDAYGVGMLTSLNDILYSRGLTPIDRRTIGDGASIASTWADWPFAPVRYEGMTKHSMASVLRTLIHSRQFAIAGFDEIAYGKNGAYDVGVSEACNDFMALTRQLGNMKAVQNKSRAGYSTYAMSNNKLGDDCFDAAIAAAWALSTRGGIDIPAMIAMSTKSREQMLGNAGALAAMSGSRMDQLPEYAQ